MHYDLSDQYVHRSSVVHRLDPRVKVVATLLYILAVGITPEGVWWAFILQLGLLLVVILRADLSIFYTIKRSFIAAPFILAALAVPFTTPGRELLQLPGLGWTLTQPGLIRFGSILFRAWLAVQSAILLSATTRIPEMFWALGALRLPRLLVATIRFMYRYLFVLADEASRMLRARASRSPRIKGAAKPSLFWQGRVAGSMVGSLFLRSIERSERVYEAMLSRGYDGQMRSLVRFHMRHSDWIFILSVGLCLCMVQVFANLR
ncbi:MAG: cobalt ECF transporter T component CbiQ [Chloroflexi bacterium RBG_16_48_8]|nr:MAG: cobalt ECF transporter T component CbiQ [Chloroflexi bacterium RBG_16_48_8]